MSIWSLAVLIFSQHYTFHFIKFLHLQIPFFCGMSPQCWEPGSEWALAQAKLNLASRFLVVGVTEQFENFIEVSYDVT